MERNTRNPDGHPQPSFSGISATHSGTMDEAVPWLEQALPHIMRRLMDSENLDMPLLQLPLAQLRLAQALYQGPAADADTDASTPDAGETMGQLSERLGVRHNALTQAADRLINHGLAERVGDPRDRRIVRLRLTSTGRDWVQARRERRRAHLAALWSQLTAEERARFLQAVLTLEEIGRRLDVNASAVPFSTATSPVQTVEETLTRFMAGVDLALTSAPLSGQGDSIIETQNTTAEPPATHAHVTSRKEDE